MNKRSPRVVGMGKKPLRAMLGERHCHTVMPTSIKPMQMKKMATSGVQAIQPNRLAVLSVFSMSDPPHRETLGDVMAHEPDHQRAGHDGQDAGGRQHAPVHAGRRHRARHGGGNRLGINGSQGTRNSNSTQLNMKQKKAVTPTPDLIIGKKM